MMSYRLFAIVCFLLITPDMYGRDPISGDRYELLSGVKIDDGYKYSGITDGDLKRSAPAKFLAESYYHIPKGGKILDISLRDGKNAVFLSRKGFNVSGLDISSESIKKATALAFEFGVDINFIQKSVYKFDPGKKSLDAIICFYFERMDLIPRLMSWLKPGGVLILEGRGEWLKLFKDHRIVKYEESGIGEKNRSSIIVKKR
ncbi:MAG: class I SAM-dependent methyltransferase [Bacteriovoracaceae bacterium]|nr:class I SAM-dependent methyltransferase [Bacteriovoracaceae bacterium]